MLIVSVIYSCRLFAALSLSSVETRCWADTGAATSYSIYNTKADTAIHDACLLPGGTILMISYGSGKIYRTDCKNLQPQLVTGLDSVYYEKIFFTTGNTGWIAGEC